MSDFLKKLISVSIAAALIISLLAACNNDQDPDDDDTELVYSPEFISMPNTVSDMQNLTYSDNMLYFSSLYVVDERKIHSGTKLFSVNIDGTNLTELVNYRPETELADGVLCSTYIIAMSVDIDGNLWVAELEMRFRYALPEGIDIDDLEDADDIFQYQQQLGTFTNLRKLDNTGAELFSAEISDLVGKSTPVHTVALYNDDEGNIYIGTNSDIIVLDANGDSKFSIELPGSYQLQKLIMVSDRRVAFFGYDRASSIVRTIDIERQSWGETIELPEGVHNALSGSGDYSLFYTDHNGLFGYNMDMDEYFMVLSWADNGLIYNSLDNIMVLPDNRVLCTGWEWQGDTTLTRSFEIIIFNLVRITDLPEMTVLTLVTFEINEGLQNAVAQFNRKNRSYRVEVIDVAEHDMQSDWTSGITKLNIDIITGNIVPDILDLSQLPYKQYASRGLLEDLYIYIDSDRELRREDFIESVHSADEVNGGLYRVFPGFRIASLIGSPDVVGTGEGWNMNEFMAVLDANPQADIPLGQWMDKLSFLHLCIQFGMDEYVDWDTGTTRFDTDSFIQLLEFINTLPDDPGADMSSFQEEPETIISGRQILFPDMGIWYSFDWIQVLREVFGGEIVFKGFPTESRNGNAFNINWSLAISSNSENKNGAWEFIRTILMEDWQLSRYNMHAFPTNRAALDVRFQNAMSSDNVGEITGWNDWTTEIEAVTQAEVDWLLAQIDSITSTVNIDIALMNIILEGAGDFFNGLNSAQDAARIIQNRASTYVSEQSG